LNDDQKEGNKIITINIVDPCSQIFRTMTDLTY
jgi:hypothetical protein